MSDLAYDVLTDLPPEAVTRVGLEIYKKWIDFALGATQLGGRSIISPTGKYASAISFRRYGANHVAIIADENIAKEANILETGHSPIDMLKYLNPGQSYPMHRGARMAPFVGPPRKSNSRKMWAQIRESGFSGRARPPAVRRPGKMNTSKTGPEWMIPEMPAYSPAMHLVDLIRNMV